MHSNNLPEYVVWQQKTAGLIIVVGSSIASVLAFVDGYFILGMPVLHVLSHPSVWLSAFFVPTAALTVVYVGSVGQWVQILFCFIAAIASAVTSGPADLTSLVFLGIGYLLAGRYRKIDKNVYRVYLPFTAVYVFLWIVTNMHVVGGPFTAFLFSILGGSTLLLLILSIVRSTAMEQRDRRNYLEQEVQERTADLKTALKHQRQLSKKNEVLLRELHHRTKNNLQIIASLLSIQRGRIDDAKKRATAVLEQAEQRIQTLAATHEVFHRTDRLDAVDLTEYIRSIIAAFSHTAGVLELHLDDSGVENVVEMDTAVLLGLILNEVLTNVVEHAYPGEAMKPLWITLTRNGSLLSIDIADRGVGIPNSVVLEPPETAGMEIITALIAQLKGTLRITRKPHTVWHIELAQSS